jgi:predicted transcriptional regulator
MKTTIKLTISLPAELAQFVDRLAAEVHRPRSQILADLVEEKRREVFRKSLIEGYQSLAAENRRFASEAMHISAEVWGEVDDST